MKLIAPAFAGFVSTLAIAVAPAAAQADQHTDGTDSSALAADSLSQGEAAQAMALLKAALAESPRDPALLINLGIAQAQNGQEEQARVSFKAALASPYVVDLQTADGRSIDSRRLARSAIAMLNRGEFRPASRRDQLTLRD